MRPADDTARPRFAALALGVFSLGVGVFIAARLWRLTAYSLRPDEIFSLRVARHSWRGLLGLVARDVVHPPLFYLLLKIWIRVGGQSELWLRLFPLLTAVASIGPFVLVCRALRLRAAETNLALLLMAVNAYLIYYAQELRMYSLLLCFTLCSIWLLVESLNAADRRRTRLGALLAANLLLVYTHYYGWVVVGLELIVLLIWERRALPAFSGSIAFLILCFSPWAYTVVTIAARRGGLESNIGSFPRPTIGDLIGYYATLNGPFHGGWTTILGLALFGGPVVLWARHVHKNRVPRHDPQARTLWWLSMFAFMPVLFSYAVSQWLPQSVWGLRFLIIAAPPYLALVTLAVYRLDPAWMKLPLILILSAWAALAGLQGLNDSGKNAWAPLVRQMMLVEDSSLGNIMVYTFGSSDETIAFYLEEAGETRFRTKRVKAIAEMTSDHFWVALRESKARSPQRSLMDAGYRVGEGFRDGFGGLLFPAWRR